MDAFLTCSQTLRAGLYVLARMLQTKSICIILAVVLMVTIVDAGRNRRGRSRSSYRPDTKLQTLKAQIRACMGKFVCDVVTSGGVCMPVCIDGKKVCDGTPDCDNKRDEPSDCPAVVTTTTAGPPTTTTGPPTTTTGPPTTTAGPPTTTTACTTCCEPLHFRCSAETDCRPITEVCDQEDDCAGETPEDEQHCAKCCDEGEVKCGDVCGPLCDGIDDCADSIDEPTSNCGCAFGATASFCLDDLPTADATKIADLTLPQCQTLCRDDPTCLSVVHAGTSCWTSDVTSVAGFTAETEEDPCPTTDPIVKVFLCT